MLESLSFSKIQTYLLCPRKFKYRYIDRLEPAFRSSALAFGSAVHSALAWLQEERIEGREPSADELARVFRADWRADTAGHIMRWERQGPDELLRIGLELVRLFRELDQPIPQAVEQRFEVELPDVVRGGSLPIPLVGYIDALDAGVVVELKTTARKAKPTNWLLQLSAYAYAFEAQNGIRARARVIQLVKTKEPQVEVGAAYVDPTDIMWFLEVAAEVHHAVRAEVFPPIPGWMCLRCEYEQNCKALSSARNTRRLTGSRPHRPRPHRRCGWFA